MLIIFLIFLLGLLTPRLAGRLAIPAAIFSKYLFYGSVILIFSVQVYWSWQQYLLWEFSGPPARYLLPPYQPLSYFYLYAYTRFFNTFILSGLAAFLFLAAAHLLNHYFKKRFFEEEEPYFAALAVFLLGQPLWLFYIPVALGLAALVSAFNVFIRKKRERFSLYYLWLPSGILLFIADLVFKFTGYF